MLYINFTTIKERKREREIDTETQRDIDRERGERQREKEGQKERDRERQREWEQANLGTRETRALFVPWTIRQRGWRVWTWVWYSVSTQQWLTRLRLITVQHFWQSRKSESGSNNAPVYKAIRPQSAMSPVTPVQASHHEVNTHTRNWDSKIPAPRRHTKYLRCTKLSPGKESCLSGVPFPLPHQDPGARQQKRRGRED